jgi:hypothetical protein
MIKLLYLFAGLTLKQTVDELKALTTAKIDDLQRQYDSLREFRPNPALEMGTAAAHRAVAESMHQSQVGPELATIWRKIRRIRMIPVIIYGLLTASLLVLIWWLENQSPSRIDV